MGASTRFDSGSVGGKFSAIGKAACADFFGFGAGLASNLTSMVGTKAVIGSISSLSGSGPALFAWKASVGALGMRRADVVACGSCSTEESSPGPAASGAEKLDSLRSLIDESMVGLGRNCQGFPLSVSSSKMCDAAFE